jgi:putative Mn2+ efflux pump MntP
VVSATILIAAEVFGATFVGGWAIALLFNLGDYGHWIVQAVLFVFGLFIMVAFVRSAQRIEPFTTRR